MPRLEQNNLEMDIKNAYHSKLSTLFCKTKTLCQVKKIVSPNFHDFTKVYLSMQRLKPLLMGFFFILN